MRRVSLTLIVPALAFGLVGCPVGELLPRFLLAIETEPAGAGVVLLEPPPGEDGAYPLGTCVRANVEPAEGQVFLGWGGDGAGVSAPVELRMDRDRTLSASFIPSDQAGLLGAWRVTRGFLYHTSADPSDYYPFNSWNVPPVDEEGEANPRVSRIFFDGKQMRLVSNGWMIPGEQTWDGRPYAAVNTVDGKYSWVAQGPYQKAENDGTFIAQLAADWPAYPGPPEVSPYLRPLLYLAFRELPIPHHVAGGRLGLVRRVYGPAGGRGLQGIAAGRCA